MSRPTHLLNALCVASLAVTGTTCRPRFAEIVVVVDSDFVAPGMLADITIQATVGGRTMTTQPVAAGTSPVTAGLTNTADDASDVTVVVTGRDAAMNTLVARTVTTQFLPDQTRTLRVVLHACCASTPETCTYGGTCETAACGPIAVAGNQLPVWTGAPPSQADAVANCAGPGFWNTGVPPGTALTAAGAMTLSQSGATVTGMDIDGCVTITASNVTIRNSRIHCGEGVAVTIATGVTGVQLDHDEIFGASVPGSGGVAHGGVTATGCNIHGVQDGFVAEHDVVVQDSWLHDLGIAAGSGSAVTAQSGLRVRIEHNRFETVGLVSCIGFKSEYDITQALSITGNWLDGGNYTIAVRDGTAGHPEAATVTSNRFGRGSTLDVGIFDTPPSWTDNVWDDSGEPVPLP